MNRKRLLILALAALAFAAALTLLLAPREGGRYGRSPAAPDGSFVGPPGPSAADIAAERQAREAAALKKAEAAKMGKRRKKRVSRLREPGDAMGGGVRLTLTDKRTGLVKKK